MIPRTIAENAGLNAPAMISSLYAAHEAGNVNAGIDIAVREIECIQGFLVDLLVLARVETGDTAACLFPGNRVTSIS